MNRISFLLTFHALTDERTDEVIQKHIEDTINLINIVKKEFKDINIIKMAVGLHKNEGGERLHSHIPLIVEVDDKLYHNKNLDKQVTIMKIRKQLDRTLHITYYKQDDPKYDEEFGFTYSFKEYETIDDVILKEHFINLENDVIEQLRKFGNDKYKQTQAENERTERRKLQSENESEDIESFISTAILNYDYKNNLLLGYEETEHLHGKSFDEMEIKDKYIFVKFQVIEYFGIKAEKSGKPILKSFKKNNVSDYAYAFLAKDPKNRYALAKMIN